jgi:hypothetical protein
MGPAPSPILEYVMSRLRLLQESKAADQAWMAEVATVFGEREAGLARFQDRANGEPGTRLRELFNLYVKARDAYEKQDG